MFDYLTKWLKGTRPADAALQGPHRLEVAESPALALSEPPVFHITHWKAGSQWINKILQLLVFERLVLPFDGEQTQFLKHPIQPGKIYPTLYVTKEEFDRVPMPAHHRRFVIIRDLRDTLISLYFSLKISHYSPEDWAQERGTLTRSDQESGLLYTLGKHLDSSAKIQKSWLHAGEPLLRYEDMLADDLGFLERLLFDHCRIEAPRQRFLDVLLACRFEALTGGRQRGQEDIKAHERKGIQGDWRNYFTDPVKQAFKERFGEILIATGYEKNSDW